jgi:uncharacterized protein YneF (UPF0154 family)
MKQRKMQGFIAEVVVFLLVIFGGIAFAAWTYLPEKLEDNPTLYQELLKTPAMARMAADGITPNYFSCERYISKVKFGFDYHRFDQRRGESVLSDTTCEKEGMILRFRHDGIESRAKTPSAQDISDEIEKHLDRANLQRNRLIRSDPEFAQILADKFGEDMNKRAAWSLNFSCPAEGESFDVTYSWADEKASVKVKCPRSGMRFYFNPRASHMAHQDKLFPQYFEHLAVDRKLVVQAITEALEIIPIYEPKTEKAPSVWFEGSPKPASSW